MFVRADKVDQWIFGFGLDSAWNVDRRWILTSCVTGQSAAIMLPRIAFS